jgi:hypothetical protein
MRNTPHLIDFISANFELRRMMEGIDKVVYSCDIQV